MDEEGPDPNGSGPSSSSELESARRRLYSPGGATAAAVARYEHLAADRAAAVRLADPVPAVAEPAEPGAEVAETPGARRRPRRRTVVLAAAASVGILAGVIALIVGGHPALPERVAVPALAGTTLFAYERMSDHNTGSGSVTYQPEGYTLYQPAGRIVAVAVHCVGVGSVTINAGTAFTFRCSDDERTSAIRDYRVRSRGFYIVSRTTGNVVWAARIVLLPPPQTAGAIPDFRTACDSCSMLAR